MHRHVADDVQPGGIPFTQQFAPPPLLYYRPSGRFVNLFPVNFTDFSKSTEIALADYLPVTYDGI